MLKRLLSIASKLFFVKKCKDFLYPVYNSIVFLLNRKLLKRNVVLRNLHNKKRCIIIGTGRSVDDIGFSELEGEIAFGTNLLFMHKDFHRLNITYYFIPSTIYGLMKTPDKGAKPPMLFINLEKFCKKNTKFFFDISVRKLLAKKRILNNRIKYYMMSTKMLKSNKMLNFNFTKRNDFMIGAVFTMIAAAMYMGFKEIYMLGMGYTYRPFQPFHFYDDYKSTEAKNFAQSIKDTRVEHRHLLLNKLSRRIGVKIFNVVPEGYSSPVYTGIKKEDFYRILSKQRGEAAGIK